MLIYVINEKVKVIERTYTGEVYEWDGVATNITESYVETKHARNPITHPYWHAYMKAYSDTWTRHYFHPDGEFINIKKESI